MRYIPNNAPIRDAMLAEMGMKNLDELFESIPKAARLGRELNLPPGLAEEDHLARFQEYAQANTGQHHTAFLGGGSYPHYIPLTADALLQRGEFLTAYTPYQPEVSQGTLQAIFEFQSFMTLLTGLDVANASMYDGASATAEAVLMANRVTRNRKRVLLPQSLHPHYRAVTQTHTHYLGLPLETVPMHAASGQLDLSALEKALQPDGAGEAVSCVVLQQPNFFGVVEDVAAVAEKAKAAGALLIVVVTEALSLALLQPPGEAGADIVVGEAQSFGVPVYYGGPYLGFMTTRDAYKRQLPGRIAGETVDSEGRRGFVLTLATREQHIRREKATSNICTNQNLVMLSALMYLTLMGSKGLSKVAGQNVSMAAYLRQQIEALPGYSIAFSAPSFNEFTVSCPRPAGEVAQSCLDQGIVPGLDLGRWDAAMEDKLLIAVTETKRKADVDNLINALREAAS